MGMRPWLLLPEMVLFLTGLAVLMWGSFLPRQRQWLSRLLALAGLIGGAVTGAVAMAGTDGMAFSGTYAVDTATAVARITASLGTAMVVLLAADEVAASPRESEIYALLLFATTGTVIMAGANDLLVLVGGFLLASIPLYALVGVVGTRDGAEAAMKTYLIGALFGVVLLTGVTILYGLAASTMYADLASVLPDVSETAVAGGVIALVAGLMFKAGGVPAHYWVPDAAQGSHVSVAAFLTTIPKIGALLAIYRLAGVLPGSVDWRLLVAALAVAGMTLGNLAAYWQDDPRRLLGWSTVSQVGFLLVPAVVVGRSELAQPSLLLYVIAYTVTNLAAFAVVAALPERRTLDSYVGLAASRPWLAGSLVVALLGLIGIPPTGIFVGKLTTASAAWDGGYAWLAVAVLANTVISLFYYLRWIAPTYRRVATPAHEHGAGPAPGPTRPWSAGTAVVAAILSVIVGIGTGLVWDLLSPPIL
jgi:NADH-quinone oxidoreductase subunit N